MIPADVTQCLTILDGLQDQVFDRFEDIVNIGDPLTGGSVESIDFIRSSISKDATKLIGKFENTLNILKIKVNNYIGTFDVDHDRLKIIFELYQDKLSNLKHQLKETELKSYRLEEEFNHKQRMKSFSKVPEREKTFEEMKQELFDGRSNEDKELKERDVEQQLLDTNKSVTASLKNTRQLMAASIIQTELSIDSLDQQSKDLNSFNGLLDELNNTLKKSKNIVKFIEKQDRSDKNRIYLSLGFLMVCCAWVIWRRILKLPVKILLWSTIKVFRIFLWFMPSKVLNAEEVISSQVLASEMSATAVATLSTLAIVSTITSTISTSISTISTGSSIPLSERLNEEIIMDMEVSKTWEEIVTEVIKDEL
ncbi:protein transport protein Sec20p [[Candida] jaroonii]|uniref:Protein transport protein Sec20p n=1 Tax=[Candida] jaroonii TaxID=467808 RepID=A0ACA9Y1X6_9ASCO|nr:protein transport protein Sec20p [[Candida] jaroonii]